MRGTAIAEGDLLGISIREHIHCIWMERWSNG